MSPPRVAIVTCAAQSLLYAEEREILPRLRKRGVDADAVLWSDENADWSRFDAVVIRSTWDYFTRYDEFRAWLDRVEHLARVYNPPSLVRWNSDKHYLRDLEQRGVQIVPTVFCEAGERADLAKVLRESGWKSAVIKPCVSGGAYRTHRVSAEDAAEKQAEMDALLATTAVLVQPFVPEIQSEGEWSLVFFGGAFSHAVLKVPGAGDYRVQPEHGATFADVKPEPWLVEQAQSVLRALPEPPAYARIDGVRRGRDLILMEAELIEPYLYMAAAPRAMDAFVELVEKLAHASRREPH
ncbi:MAG: ATP-grasp domain-containing protein [Polyangiaceae bacterium]|jgi:hypothetical protein